MTTIVWRFAAAVPFLLLAVSAVSAAERTDLTLLHVNDVYEISPINGRGGFAPLMTVLERERARATNTLTTFGGDVISPSVLSALSKGAQMIELMNAIGVDAAGFGNHEFDFGGAVLVQRIAESRFTWLATNTLDADGEPFGGARRLMTREFGGLKIGLFGLLTPEAGQLSSPGAEVRFLPVTETAAKAVSALEEQGADLVIALTHLTIAEDRTLARKVRGIDVILGGHDHEPILFYEDGTLIIKAGHDAHYLAVVDLQVEWEQTPDGVRVRMLPEMRFVSTAGVAQHAGVAALVEKHEARLDRELNVVVGRTAVELDSRRAHVRTMETGFGNLVADAMRETLGTDVAIANGGGIRGDRVYPEGTALTRRDILSELPFGNLVVSMSISGAYLRDALENGVSRIEDMAGRFPQVSGMSFSFDPEKPPGSRVLAVKVGGKSLDENATYTLATSDYLAKGGDGYSMLKKGRLLIDPSGGKLMASVVMDYVTARGTVAPKIEQRIRPRP